MSQREPGDARALVLTAPRTFEVRDWQASDRLGPAERAVLAATDEMLDTDTITDETWRACREHLGDDAQLIELVVAIGNWRLFAALLRSLAVPLEDGVAPWPPDSVTPG